MIGLGISTGGLVAKLPGLSISTAGLLDADLGAGTGPVGANAPDELHLGARAFVGQLAARAALHTGPGARVEQHLGPRARVRGG